MAKLQLGAVFRVKMGRLPRPLNICGNAITRHGVRLGIGVAAKVYQRIAPSKYIHNFNNAGG